MAGQSPRPDPRLTGLARILGLSSLPDGERRAALLVARAGELGAALAAEAAESDDVTDADSAAAYLQLRLLMLGDLIPGGALPALREEFERRTTGW